MSLQIRNVAAPSRDKAPSRSTTTHHPEPENGAVVYTEMHHSTDSTRRSQPGERPSDAAKLRPQVEGAEPFTKTPPPQQRGPSEGAADVAAAHTELHRLQSSLRAIRAPDRAASRLLRDVCRELEDPKDLPGKQRRAIELLLDGKSYTQIAEQLGVDRSTLWRWRNRDGDFRRALETARETAFRDADCRVRELVPRALQVLEERLADGDYQAAIRVLNLARIDGQKAAQSFQSRKGQLERLGGRKLIE